MQQPTAKSLVQSQFGPKAEKYASSLVHAKGASLTRLVELVQPQNSWRALDIATAAGHTALAFAPHVDEVIASDITPQMLEQASRLAAERGIDNLTTAAADADDLPFDNASFDLVSCRIAPHHFPDIPAFLAEVYRVLKPGGTFALVDNLAPGADSPPTEQHFTADELSDAATAYNAFEKLRDRSHVRSLPLREWQDLINKAGLQERHCELLAKPMEFQPWAERMLGSEDPETIAYLRAILKTATPALKAFLQPEDKDGSLWFSEHEALIIAQRPCS